MFRLAFTFAVLALIVASPGAYAAFTDEVSVGDVGPIRGKCIMVRGLTGISVTLANCLPGVIPQ